MTKMTTTTTTTMMVTPRSAQLRAHAPDVIDAPPWRINDEVIHLRAWGTRILHALPSGLGRAGAIIGAARNCWLRIKSSPGIAPQHARLARAGDRWTLRNLGDSAGVRVDGIEHSVVSLVPGAEIELGGITLIAESPRLVALRELIARLLGWAPERAGEIDLALRAVRMAALRRAPLLLCGVNGDVVTAARLLHRHTLGHERPFVICAPRRSLRRSTCDEPMISDALKALKAAASGTLCIWQGSESGRLMRAIHQLPTWPAQVMICTSPLAAAFKVPIALPALRRRAAELERIIDAYLEDACAKAGGTFSSADRVWIRRHDAATHASIEFAARRAVALRSNDGAINRTARVLGMAHSALSEWVARRKIPGLVAVD
jgi:hypothetical protein